jgi:hypothetical protein
MHYLDLDEPRSCNSTLSWPATTAPGSKCRMTYIEGTHRQRQRRQHGRSAASNINCKGLYTAINQVHSSI